MGTWGHWPTLPEPSSINGSPRTPKGPDHKAPFISRPTDPGIVGGGMGGSLKVVHGYTCGRTRVAAGDLTLQEGLGHSCPLWFLQCHVGLCVPCKGSGSGHGLGDCHEPPTQGPVTVSSQAGGQSCGWACGEHSGQVLSVRGHLVEDRGLRPHCPTPRAGGPFPTSPCFPPSLRLLPRPLPFSTTSWTRHQGSAQPPALPGPGRAQLSKTSTWEAWEGDHRQLGRGFLVLERKKDLENVFSWFISYLPPRVVVECGEWGVCALGHLQAGFVFAVGTMGVVVQVEAPKCQPHFCPQPLYYLDQC